MPQKYCEVHNSDFDHRLKTTFNGDSGDLGRIGQALSLIAEQMAVTNHLKAKEMDQCRIVVEREITPNSEVIDSFELIRKFQERDKTHQDPSIVHEDISTIVFKVPMVSEGMIQNIEYNEITSFIEGILRCAVPASTVTNVVFRDTGPGGAYALIAIQKG